MLTTLASFAGPKEVTLKKDTKIKVEYTSQETNDMDAIMTFEVKEDVFAKLFNVPFLVIPKGSQGEIKITRLGGFRKDIVTDVEGKINAIDNTTVDLVFYKGARKKLRKAIKGVAYIGLLDPPGIAIKAGEIVTRRVINPYNLPSKLFTKEDMVIQLRS